MDVTQQMIDDVVEEMKTAFYDDDYDEELVEAMPLKESLRRALEMLESLA